MNIVNEKSTWVVTVTFSDEDGNPVTPDSAKYRIDDSQSGTAIKGDTVITPIPGPTVEIEITKAENKICNSARVREIRVVTVSFVYNNDKDGTATYRYLLKNLSFVPDA